MCHAGVFCISARDRDRIGSVFVSEEEMAGCSGACFFDSVFGQNITVWLLVLGS